MSVVNFYFFRADNVCEILHILAERGSIVHIESDSGFRKGSEYFVHVTNVSLYGVLVNDNFIDVEKTGITPEGN